MAFAGILSLMWVLFIVGGLVTLIIWLIVMNKALDQVSHDIRKMEPGAVWLCMIPLFGLVWQFMVNAAVANGIAGEFAIRNLFPKEPKPGYAPGLTGCILMCCCIIPYAGVGIAMIGLIFMIVHIVRISEYNKVLEQSGRWEILYQQRMAALRQQQQTNWQHMQVPQQMPVQNYQRQTQIPDQNAYAPKEQPKNPFG